MKKICKHSFPEVAKSVTQTNDMKQCRCMTSSLLLTAFCHLEPNVAQTKHRITIMAHWPWLALWWLGIDRNSYWLKFLCISFAPSICSHVQKLQTLLLFSWRFRSVSLSRSSLSVHRWVQKIGTALLDIQQVQKNKLQNNCIRKTCHKPLQTTSSTNWMHSNGLQAKTDLCCCGLQLWICIPSAQVTGRKRHVMDVHSCWSVCSDCEHVEWFENIKTHRNKQH